MTATIFKTTSVVCWQPVGNPDQWLGGWDIQWSFPEECQMSIGAIGALALGPYMKIGLLALCYHKVQFPRATRANHIVRIVIGSLIEMIGWLLIIFHWYTGSSVQLASPGPEQLLLPLRSPEWNRRLVSSFICHSTGSGNWRMKLWK